MHEDPGLVLSVWSTSTHGSPPGRRRRSAAATLCEGVPAYRLRARARRLRGAWAALADGARLAARGRTAGARRRAAGAGQDDRLVFRSAATPGRLVRSPRPIPSRVIARARGAVLAATQRVCSQPLWLKNSHWRSPHAPGPRARRPRGLVTPHWRLVCFIVLDPRRVGACTAVRAPSAAMAPRTASVNGARRARLTTLTQAIWLAQCSPRAAMCERRPVGGHEPRTRTSLILSLLDGRRRVGACTATGAPEDNGTSARSTGGWRRARPGSAGWFKLTTRSCRLNALPMRPPAVGGREPEERMGLFQTIRRHSPGRRCTVVSTIAHKDTRARRPSARPGVRAGAALLN